jgi:hypothetical protein
MITSWWWRGGPSDLAILPRLAASCQVLFDISGCSFALLGAALSIV